MLDSFAFLSWAQKLETNVESEKQRFVDVNGSSFPEQDGLAFWSRCGSEPVGPTQAAQNQPAVWAGSFHQLIYD